MIQVFCLGLVIQTQAQQTPQYTQYMYNMSVVNPAYMIDEPGMIQLGSLYRNQWVGVEGAPKTANVFAHIPLNDKIQLSANYINDKIGSKTIINQNIFNLDFAYKLTLTETTSLSLGLKAGVNQLGVDFSGAQLTSGQNFQNTSQSSLNIGTGAYLFGRKSYVGISTPNLIPNQITSADKNVFKEQSHVYFIGGYVFDVTRSIKFKPSTVVKYVNQSPLTFDVASNFLFNEKFEVGASYRYQDAVNALVGFYINPNLRIGYAYDYGISDLNYFNKGSHEIILLYRLDLLKFRNKYSSPRFY